MQFAVIEFKDGGISVVRSEWLTPRKKEVYWPADKEHSRFERLLLRGGEISENWTPFPIVRIFL